MYLEQSKLNTKKRNIEWCILCHFETVIFKDFFYLSNSRSYLESEKINVPHWVSNLKWNFLFFNLELVTRKQKNKSLTIELVTRSFFFFFFFSIITLYTKNVKQIKNTINSAPITIYVVEGKLNVKKKKKKSELN